MNAILEGSSYVGQLFENYKINLHIIGTIESVVSG